MDRNLKGVGARIGVIGMVILSVLIPCTTVASVCEGISEAPATALTTVRVASGFLRPTFLSAPPGDVQRLFVLEQDGLIRIVEDGVILPTPFLDVTSLTWSPGSGGGNEEGLLGLAFHPDYPTDPRFFIYHTVGNGGPNNVVASYEVSGDPDVADSASRQVVITIPHTNNANHNGGMIAFGPDDGYLHLGPGDGGGICDLPGNGQNLNTLLGKLLRIDVDAFPLAYGIPGDNPFVGVAGLDEIWAYGLRNPWRFSFDAETADLYVADVGQFATEEVDFQAAASGGGENYGWDRYEGTACPVPRCNFFFCFNPPANHIPPVVEYSHDAGACSITGGYVYRGCRMPELRGTYFYADYCVAFIHSFRMVGGSATDLQDRTVELQPGGGMVLAEITSFGQDGRGEIYILDRGQFGPPGEVYKIVPVLANLEVSAIGAAPFLLSSVSDWVWEDLEATSMHPIDAYRIYRTIGNGSGSFDCVQESALPSWTGGDLDNPGVGESFSYLVTALNASGEESSPGSSTSGVPRLLSVAACPP